MNQPIYITGVAMTPFGRHDASMQDMAQTAVLGALADAGIEGAAVTQMPLGAPLK